MRYMTLVTAKTNFLKSYLMIGDTYNLLYLDVIVFIEIPLAFVLR